MIHVSSCCYWSRPCLRAMQVIAENSLAEVTATDNDVLHPYVFQHIRLNTLLQSSVVKNYQFITFKAHTYTTFLEPHVYHTTTQRPVRSWVLTEVPRLPTKPADLALKKQHSAELWTRSVQWHSAVRIVAPSDVRYTEIRKYRGITCDGITSCWLLNTDEIIIPSDDMYTFPAYFNGIIYFSLCILLCRPR